MSVRAELVRLGLRFFMKPTDRPEVTIAERRRRLAEFRALGTRSAARHGDDRGRAGRRPHPPCRDSGASRPGPATCCILHGGGYATGSPAMYSHLLWRLAAAADARVAAIRYRLAPEHPFPAALDDAVAAWRGLLDGGADPRGRPRSAIRRRRTDVALGAAATRRGCAAAGRARRLIAVDRSRGERRIAARQRACGPDDERRRRAFLAANYLNGADPRQPYASPLYGDLAGMPATLIQVGGDEVLRDDAAGMAERLRAAGCAVELEIWPRMPHVFQAFAGVLPEARRAILSIGSFLTQRIGAA